MSPVSARNYIDGNWAVSGDLFESVNPARRSEIVGTAPRSNAADVDAAVAAAKHAYETWRDLSWVKRAEYVDTFAQLVKRGARQVARGLEAIDNLGGNAGERRVALGVGLLAILGDVAQ